MANHTLNEGVNARESPHLSVHSRPRGHRGPQHHDTLPQLGAEINQLYDMFQRHVRGITRGITAAQIVWEPLEEPTEQTDSRRPAGQGPSSSTGAGGAGSSTCTTVCLMPGEMPMAEKTGDGKVRKENA